MWLLGGLLAALLLLLLAVAPKWRDDAEDEPSGDSRRSVDMWVLESPDGRAKLVLENYGEHHMDAEHVVVRLDRSFEGCSTFQGTNVKAFFAAAGRLLIVHDACVILALDYEDKAARHLESPAGWYLINVRLTGTRLEADLYDSGSGRSVMEPIELLAGDARWRPGLGLATPGLLPSAHAPSVVR